MTLFFELFFFLIEQLVLILLVSASKYQPVYDTFVYQTTKITYFLGKGKKSRRLQVIFVQQQEKVKTKKELNEKLCTVNIKLLHKTAYFLHLLILFSFFFLLKYNLFTNKVFCFIQMFCNISALYVKATTYLLSLSFFSIFFFNI